jgi:hypothetical protein
VALSWLMAREARAEDPAARRGNETADALSSRSDGAGSRSNITAANSGSTRGADPLAAKRPAAFGKATSVIFLFMEGGPSHIDLFDPKPTLDRLAGQRLPPSFGTVITPMGVSDSPLLGCRRKWARHGRSGLWVSDWLPNTARHADDRCVVRSCVGNGINHSTGMSLMNTGSPLAGRPSLGAWVTYGLGTENRDLPAFCVLCDSTDEPVNGPRNWGPGFMPALYQGTRLRGAGSPVPDLDLPAGVSKNRRRAALDALAGFDRPGAERRSDRSELDARLRNHELAWRMQSSAPEAVDLAGESAATRRLYGLDDSVTGPFGRICLLGRRLVERGVRFVQLFSGTNSKWDAHAGLEKNHEGLCRQTDLPVAGLLADLKSRGMLDTTLVIWGGEFGRTPMSEKGDGRDHNPYGFTMWMAGGGVRGGRTLGATDEVGLRAVEQPIHVHDLHATILHLMGVDHRRLIWPNQGRPERVDANEGHVVTPLVT